LQWKFSLHSPPDPNILSLKRLVGLSPTSTRLELIEGVVVVVGVGVELVEGMGGVEVAVVELSGRRT